MKVDVDWPLLMDWPEELRAKGLEVAERVMREQASETSALAEKELQTLPPQARAGDKLPGGVSASTTRPASNLAGGDGSIRARADVERSHLRVSTVITAEMSNMAPAASKIPVARSGRVQVIDDTKLIRPQVINITQVNSAASPEQPYNVSAPTRGGGRIGVDDLLEEPETPEPVAGNVASGRSGNDQQALAIMRSVTQSALDSFIRRFLYYFWGQ